jgi:hypothetical protein
MTAFVARTPLKVALVDRHRGRSLPRTALARRVAAIELIVLIALVGAAVLLADAPFWVPAAVAAPLVMVELWFDVRSQSRRLVPELAGAIGVCAVVSMIVLADDGDARLSAALWVVLVARIVSSIPYVRSQIARLHGRTAAPATELAADGAAITAAAVAVALDRRVVAGAVAVVLVVVVQRLMARGPVPRAAVLGIRQMALGFGVVAAPRSGSSRPDPRRSGPQGARCGTTRTGTGASRMMRRATFDNVSSSVAPRLVSTISDAR